MTDLDDAVVERVKDRLIEVDGRATGLTYSHLMRELARTAITEFMKVCPQCGQPGCKDME